MHFSSTALHAYANKKACAYAIFSVITLHTLIDRAQEQSNHALMLRELQKLLQEERTQRQDLELRLEETREALAGRAYAAGQMEGFELQTKQLSREVEELKGELQALREEKNRPDPRLQELQEEAASLKSHFQAQLQQEMRKVIIFISF